MQAKSYPFFAFVLVFAASSACAQTQQRIVISAPGPHSISYLPIDLIPAIGADQEEGVAQDILHAALETRSDVIANEPKNVEKMVRMLTRK